MYDEYGRPYWLLDKRKKTKACEYCGVRLTRTTGTIDHKIPKLWGGDYNKDNVAIVCKSCNKLKGGEMTSTTYIHLLQTLGKKKLKALKDEMGLDKFNGCKTKRGKTKTKNSRKYAGVS